jgi:serine/threonine protein kinase
MIMDRLAKAFLANGTEIDYVITDNPPKGGMKHTYFSPDKSYVVQFFNDSSTAQNPIIRERIEAIIGRYNPTVSESRGGAKGNDEKTAEYFSKCFCWPIGIVVYPEFGIVCPTYPKNFFFDRYSSDILQIAGKDKKSNWFTNKNRKYLSRSELGDLRTMMQISIMLSRSIRRMHQAGLAHSDLSFNNVLIDPKTGTCVVIDIDTLVVPGLFPPEVIGTRGYIAPEVLSTLGQPREVRKYPSVYTDLHSLPVLIYEYLFFRHPLMGPKIYAETAEEDDYLGLGEKATFIENPYDTSNRPKDLDVTIDDMGEHLKKLFIRAFVDGLHEPDLRPTAMEWELGLAKTWDMLHSCSNPSCSHRWFVLHDEKNPVCPYCKTRISDREFVKIKFSTQSRGHKGQWLRTGEMIAENNTPLGKWHIFSNVFPDEKTEKSIQAYVCSYNGRWIMVNKKINGMISPSGNIVPPEQAFYLEDGMIFRLSSEEKSVLAEVSIIKT